jgi:hypothetical protein
MKTRSVSHIGWPDGLAWRLLWSGSSVSTAAKLAKLAKHAGGPSRAALGIAAYSIAEAWRTGDAGEVLREYAGYTQVLRQFSVDHDLGIFDAGHEQLTEAAMLNDLVYKPAGAGANRNSSVSLQRTVTLFIPCCRATSIRTEYVWSSNE